MDSHHLAHEARTINTNVFGFWVYLMSDCVLFATLFATYAVLSGNLAGGPSAKELFDLDFVLVETLLLLTSSFTCGLALLSMHKGSKSGVLNWLTVTLLLGAGFLGMELFEFQELVLDGDGPSRSAFLSAFFTLVGTHGLHITAGIIAMVVLMRKVARDGLSPITNGRLMNLGLFWHFLDIVWIFIFSVVYLFGAL